MLRHSFFLTLLTCIVLPLRAQWVATTSAAQASVQSPRIAAALEAAMRFDSAILSKDVAAFESLLAEDAVVNNPYHRIARKQDAVNNLRNGMIDYARLERSVEYAALRGAHEVLLMGEEAVSPQGKALFAGQQVRRRTTEIWTDASGSWKLSVRQATYFTAP